MARGSRDLLKLLANGTNREILSVLRAEATYPRRLAELVGITEGEAQKRLRQMEGHGLVKGQWVHVGKNVKRYTLEAKALRVEVGPEGLSLSLEGAGARAPVRLAASPEAVPAAEHVVGRAAEMAEVGRLVEEKGAVALLGIAGTGKTSLAARFARAQPRPVFWTTLRGTEGAPTLLSRLAVFLGSCGLHEVVASYVHLDAGQDLNAQVALLTEGLARTGALVVVDDVHQAKDEALRGALAALLERCGPFRVLLSGRSVPKGLPRARLALVSLGGLDAGDTRAFLDTHGLPASAEEAEGVRQKTGGHPLALTLLAEAARHRHVELRELAALLPETRIEAYLWDEVFSDLGPEDRAFLSRLSVLRGPVDAGLAEEVAGDKRARERLYVLERRHLCNPVGDAYAIHDVVRQFAGPAGKARAESHQRAARAMEARGGLADALEAMHHHLEAAEPRGALAIARREADEHAYRFADMGLAQAYGALLERLAPAVRGEDRALVLLEAAACRLTVGPSEQALALLAEAGKLLGPRAPARLRLREMALGAHARHRMNDLPRAAREFGRVLELAAEEGEEEALDDALAGRANALEDQGKLGLAARDYLKALDRARRAGDLRKVAHIESGLARVRIHQRQQADALRHIERGLEAAEAFDDVRAESNLRRSLAEYWLFRKEYDRAWKAAEHYLQAARRLGDPWSVSCALTDAAWVAIHRRRFEDARHLAEEVGPLHARTPLPFFLAQAQAMLVLCAGALGPWEEFEAAARRSGDPTGQLNWFYGSMFIADLQRTLAEVLPAEARPDVERALRDPRPLAPWVRGGLEDFLGGRGRGRAMALPPAQPGRVARVARRKPAPARRGTTGTPRRSTP
jgi:DNA-binding Lrp family transcriptional regulator/tetratricopeptide (TPR) repeat protein